MQQNVIVAVSYPVVSKDSVKFIKAINNDGGKITFVSSDTPVDAQYFGGEVGAVVEFLNYHVKPTMENTWKFSFTPVQSKEPA